MDTAQSVDPSIAELMSRAVSIRQHAYCPYSDFRVGAAVLCEDGSMFTGTNVENASYGLTVCAERGAVMNAVSAGHRKFTAIAICCDVKDNFAASCGACRQVLAEFSLDWDIYLIRPDTTWQKVSMRELLPMAFTPASLEQERTTNWTLSGIHRIRQTIITLLQYSQASWKLICRGHTNFIYGSKFL